MKGTGGIANGSSWEGDPHGKGVPSTHSVVLHSQWLPSAGWERAAAWRGKGNGFGLCVCCGIFTK